MYSTDRGPYDIATLRRLLEDYYGTAMFNGFPMAVVDLVRIKGMTDAEILAEARKCKLI